MAANAAALSSVARQRFLSPPTLHAAARLESRGYGSPRGRSASSLPVGPRGASQIDKRPQLSWRTSRAGAGSGRGWAVASVAVEDPDVIPVRSGDAIDQQEGLAVAGAQEEDVVNGSSQVGGFAFEGGATPFGDVGVGFSSSPGSSSASPPPMGAEGSDGEEFERMVDRAINATIVLAAGTAAITKLLTIDHDYWHGWTLFEILRYAPQHNWTAYEEALKTNPVLAKMMISGIVYSLGDWIAQCYEGKPLFEFDRARMFRSGLDWWVVPAKVAFDQTVWSAMWNSIYYVVLGFLRLEPPGNILSELKATFWPMLKAGWKLWPFAHLITYGVIPVEQRLLWVDCVELVWVTILSTYSNEKSEARNSESASETETKSS